MSDNFDLNLDEYRSDLNRLEKKGANDNKYILPPKEDGFLVVRFLPPAPGERLYCATRLHYINGRNFHCTRSLQNGKWRGECRICDEYNGIYDRIKKAKSKDEIAALTTLARGIKPIERNYWNVIARKYFNKDTNETETNAGPFIMPMGKTLQAKVLRAIFGDEKLQEPPLGNIAHPMKGRDFKVVTTIKASPDGKFPDYGNSKFLDISPLGTESQINEWLNNLHVLRLLREENLKTQEELQHEVDVYMGRVADNATKFDYGTQSSVVENDDEAVVLKKSPPAKTVVEDDSSLTEDEFLRELQATLADK